MRISYRWRLMLLFCAALLIVAGVPGESAHADLVYFQSVDDTEAEFGSGELQLTSLARAEESGGEPGSVTLASLGAVKLIQNATDMPSALEGAGVARIGNFIFVVGGITNDSGSPYSNKVFRTRINPANGAQVDLDSATSGDQFWLEDDALPAVRHSAQNAEEVAGRAYTAVAAVTTNATAGNGFLFVIGGQVKLAFRQFPMSSYSVLRATVQNGQIVDGSWTKMNELANGTLPSPTIIASTTRVVYEGAAAHVATVSGKTFLYLIGGRQVTSSSLNLNPVRQGSEQVFYTQIDASGNLVRPNGETNKPVWVSAATGIEGIGSRISDGTTPLDGPGGNSSSTSGLWHTAVVGGQITTAAKTENFFMVLGGQTRDDASQAFTPKVFKAIINTNGTITWVNSGGAAGATLRDSRNAHGAVMFKQIIYVVGGRAGSGAPTQDDDIATGAVNSSLQLDEIQTGQFFALSPSGLQASGPRRYAPMIVIPSSADPALGYAFMIGGRKYDSAGNPLQATAEVLRAELGKESEELNYPAEGWYVSRPFRVAIGSINNLQVRSVKWTFKDVVGTQVRIEYRIGPLEDCSNLPETWIDAGTTGQFQLPDDASSRGNCFQYRARLTTTDVTKSPELLRAGIEIEVPGAPDLTFPETVPAKFPGKKNIQLIETADAITGMEINIVNSNQYAEPTRGAGFGDIGENSRKGTFYVDLFAYPCPQAQQPPSPFHTIPIQVDPTLPCNYAYTQIDRSDMTPEKLLTLNTATRWCDPNQTGCVPVALLSPFTATGVYTVVVVVDSSGVDPTQSLAIGLVDEQPSEAGKAESNNVYSMTISITKEVIVVTDTRLIAFLPTIARPGSQ